MDPKIVYHLRLFSYVLANRTLELEILEGTDYSWIFEEASTLEQVYAIFGNVLKVDDEGKDISEAFTRCAQYIRQSCDSTYEVDPPFESWETELH